MDLAASDASPTLEASCPEEGLLPKGRELLAVIETHSKATESESVPALPNLDVISSEHFIGFCIVFTHIEGK